MIILSPGFPHFPRKNQNLRIKSFSDPINFARSDNFPQVDPDNNVAFEFFGLSSYQFDYPVRQLPICDNEKFSMPIAT